MRACYLVVAIVLVASGGCGFRDSGVDLKNARRHLTSPRGRSYFTQMLGLENSGGVLSADRSTLWYPHTGPDRGKRLLLRFGAGDSLDHATVMSAGPNGEFDVIDEIVFDRSKWKPPGTAP